MAVMEETRRWWYLQSGFAVTVALVFCLHVYTLFSQYLANPTASSFILLDDNPPNLPAITLCPLKPFPAEVLVQMGINTSCNTLGECISALEELDGLPEDLSLQELWDASLLPLSRYVESSSLQDVETNYQPGSDAGPNWKVSMTHLGPCWTLVPPALEQGEAIKPLSLNIKSQIPCSKYVSKKTFVEISCQKIEEMCNTSCAEEKLSYFLSVQYGEILIILHSPHEPPAILDISDVLVIHTTTSTDLSIVTWFSVRETHTLQSNRCISDPDYKFTKCFSLCSERELLKKFNFPSLSDLSQLPNKSHIRQFLQFRRHFLELALADGKDELFTKCKISCKLSCDHTQYSFATKSFPDYYTNTREKNVHYSLRASALYTESVTEERIYPMSKFLADLGGSLGLCFGASLLTLCHGMHRILNTILRSRYTSSEEDITTDDEILSRESHPSGLTLSCLRNIWIMCGACLCLMTFTVHFIQLTVNYLEYPTVFVTNLVKSSPPFPGVTLCPDFPFDLKSLSQRGLEFPRNSNVYEECRRHNECDRNAVIPYIRNSFPGLWESNLTLESIWDFKRPYHDALESFSYDNIVGSGKIIDTVTTMGNCYTLSPEQSDVNAVLLDIALSERNAYFFREVDFLGFFYMRKSFSYNITFLLHPIQSPPLSLGEFAIMYENKDLMQLALEITATTSKRISRSRATCREEPYSRKTCIDLCLLEDSAREVGCRLPYLPAANLPLCDNSDQYARSIKGNFLGTNKARKGCQNKCEPACNKVHYSLRPLRLIGEEKRDGTTIRLKQQTSTNLELVEQLKTSIFTYLCEIGGILGLYLGISLLDFMSWFACMFRNSFKQVPLIGTKTKLHFYKLFQIIWWLFMSAILVVISFSRLQDFFFNPKIYTKYSVIRQTWKDFPGITLCRWPPFNLTSLEALGVDLYINMCGKSLYSDDISCDSNLLGLMNSFPGLENISVFDVWEKASWNLSDILHSYTIHGVSHITGTSDPHWVPITTALNRCYRFVAPDDEKNPSDVNLYLNHYHYKFRFKNPPSLIKQLMYLINGILSPHNLIRVHSPQDKPLFNDNVYSFPVYLSSAGHHYILTTFVKEINRLKGTYLGCQGGTYSTFNCVEECLLAAIIQQQKCRLPFGTSSSSDYCNATSYRKFPKYLDKVASKLDNYSSVREACTSECPLECTSYRYLVDEADAYIRKGLSTEHVKVTVTMGDRTHDAFQEVPALSFASFLAEVGGVAGILSGMSLLMLSRFLQKGLARLYARVRNGDGELGH